MTDPILRLVSTCSVALAVAFVAAPTCSVLSIWSVAVAAAGAQDPARKAPQPPYTMATYHLAILKPGPEAGRLGGTSEGQKVVQAHVLSMQAGRRRNVRRPPDRFSTAVTSPASSSSRRQRLSGRKR